MEMHNSPFIVRKTCPRDDSRALFWRNLYIFHCTASHFQSRCRRVLLEFCVLVRQYFRVSWTIHSKKGQMFQTLCEIRRRLLPDKFNGNARLRVERRGLVTGTALTAVTFAGVRMVVFYPFG